MSGRWALWGAYLIFYAALHSLLAAPRVKARAACWLGRGMAFYRLGYVVLSALLLVPLLLLPLSGSPLYRIPPPVSWGLRILQGVALSGFLWALRSIDGREFLGLAQIRRHCAGAPPPEGQDETAGLSVRGPYRLCRHPLYFFASIGLLAQPAVTQGYALLTAWALAYFWIGTCFEERTLLRRFGGAYARYRATTPRLIPIPRRRSDGLSSAAKIGIEDSA